MVPEPGAKPWRWQSQMVSWPPKVHSFFSFRRPKNAFSWSKSQTKTCWMSFCFQDPSKHKPGWPQVVHHVSSLMAHWQNLKQKRLLWKPGALWGMVRHCIFVTHMTHMYQITYLCTSVYTSLFHNLSLSIIQIPHDFQGSRSLSWHQETEGFVSLNPSYPKAEKEPYDQSAQENAEPAALQESQGTRRTQHGIQVQEYPYDKPHATLATLFFHTQGMDSSIICDDQSRLKELGKRCIQNACMPQRSKVKIESEWKWP